MKVYNETVEGSTDLAGLLAASRAKRAFDPAGYVAQKAALINDYFATSRLKAAVVAVSGGVDSAVALALTAAAKSQPGSSIREIVPLLLPALGTDGATNQDDATRQGTDICEQLGLTPRIFPHLTKLVETISGGLDDILDVHSTPWSRGQLVAYARTPVIYNTASILTDNGLPALVIGTTNLSEGGYLGYVGKASDGLVDLQVISDLYKAQVYQVAEYLNVPASILNAVPTGDMYDGRNDEAVFGVSYDFVELYHEWLRGRVDVDESDPAWIAGRENLEHLHRYNAHKYLVGSPSIHLDVERIDIPGGWHNTPWRKGA